MHTIWRGSKPKCNNLGWIITGEDILRMENSREKKTLNPFSLAFQPVVWAVLPAQSQPVPQRGCRVLFAIMPPAGTPAGCVSQVQLTCLLLAGSGIRGISSACLGRPAQQPPPLLFKRPSTAQAQLEPFSTRIVPLFLFVSFHSSTC